MRNKFIIVTHAVLSDEEDIAGPAHTIFSYLQKKETDNLFVRHALYKGGRTLITFSQSGKRKDLVLKSGNSNELFSRIMEGYRTIKHSLPFSKGEKPIYIGIDPLNSLWGLILKKSGVVKKLVTFSADYSVQRYRNYLINVIYHFIDNLTIRNSDSIWSVSKRIEELRLNQGISRKKLFYIPNSPPFSKIKHLVKKNPDPKNLISIATISKAIDFNLVLDAISEMRQEINLRLTIIGGGPGLSTLKKEVNRRKLGKSILFIGAKSHEEVFRILSKNGIGIALYTDDASWAFYSDSMKARDYLALGLPVIISGDIGTAYEIKKANAGILINRNKNDLIDALRKLIDDKNLYNMLRKNALDLARKNDIEKILDRVFQNL